MENGSDGVHHELKPDGSRVRNDLGRETSRISPLTGNPPALYYPHRPGEAIYIQGVAKEMVEIGIDDPTLTAYSATQAAKAGGLNQLRVDRLNAIIQGREPLGALDTFIRDWRSRGAIAHATMRGRSTSPLDAFDHRELDAILRDLSELFTV
jgi:hypothetical protein